MINKPLIFREKYRGERSSSLAAVFDITDNSIGLVFYDLSLSRRFARTVLFGERKGDITQGLAGLLGSSMQEYGIDAGAVKRVGFAASVALSVFIEEAVSPAELYLRPETEIFVMPIISAAIGGRFTASLLTLPCSGLAADIGGRLCLGALDKQDQKLKCACFSLVGAFDGSAAESGVVCERGAIDEVRRDKDTLCYGVVGDEQSVGIASSALVQAAELMIAEGIADKDGIMLDRDNFYIGEDFYITQRDLRAVQTDKARSAAAFELFLREAGKPSAVFLAGEPFSRGMDAMMAIGAVPRFDCKTGFCRNSSEQGLIMCAENSSELERAARLAEKAEDITERLIEEHEALYVEKLSF
ncbi:MAG: ASKHA domain-containing protein [Oscillospiraceae bacterium]|nr:ASKHA domain-containing protein [Oscillospiraceae bacterium]